MGSIGRYIFRTTLGAFLMVLVSVTLLMWMTQALRNIDLMTSQGQSVFVFIGITALIIPLLVLLIAPIALTVAAAHVLNKLGNDSELIVMNSSGMPPSHVFRPFLAVGIVVSLLVGVIAVYVSPKCLRELRRWSTEVRTEIVTNNLQPGRFTVIEGKLTLHVRDRLPNGRLVGIMIDDQRDPKERSTIVAEHGDVLTNDGSVYLILENGTVHRQDPGRDPAIIKFDQYAFDMSRLSPGSPNIRYSVQERFPWELYDPPPDDTLFRDQPGQFRAELHNRIVMPLYPIAFVILTFAYLGAPRTTRQSRAMSLIGAIGLIAALRGIGFIAAISGIKTPAFLAIPYLTLVAAIVLGYWGIARGLIIEPPAFISNAINAAVEGLARRTAAVTRPAQ
jgi:lipopolysaccharide export system permease protein